MEESKLRTHTKPSVGSSQSGGRGAAASVASSHVIDLRAANKPAAKPPEPPAKKPRRLAKPARRPLAAPNQSTTPARSATPTSSVPVCPPQPVVASAAPLQAMTSSAEPVLPPRRFWPAFWRFLLLLVILALLVVGGVYLYINYYRG